MVVRRFPEFWIGVGTLLGFWCLVLWIRVATPVDLCFVLAWYALGTLSEISIRVATLMDFLWSSLGSSLICF